MEGAGEGEEVLCLSLAAPCRLLAGESQPEGKVGGHTPVVSRSLYLAPLYCQVLEQGRCYQPGSWYDRQPASSPAQYSQQQQHNQTRADKMKYRCAVEGAVTRAEPPTRSGHHCAL
jgi:hypothetical protein